MGDRANVVMDEQDGGKIFLYSHWGGTDLPKTLQTALRRKARWEDESYLARIIHREMIRGCENKETGFGISTTPPDNSYPYLRVNCDKQTVTIDFEPVAKYHKGGNKVLSFKEYCDAPEMDWTVLGYRS